MIIRLAQELGYCFGVKRAIKIAQRVRQQKRGKVYTLGPLIHNPQTIEKLKAQAIESVEDYHHIKEGTVIIRSHGVSSHLREELIKNNIEIIDATCPFVKRSQNLVQQLVRENYEIIIVGNQSHPEIQGIVGYCLGRNMVINKVEEVQFLPYAQKRSVIAQTTQEITLFQEIVAKLLEKSEELRVFNTICESTKIRQKTSADLASQVDIMITVGSRNSANTNRLYNICKRIQLRTYFIEKPEEIVTEMIEQVKEIGITAGASTPSEVIHQVIDRIKEVNEMRIHSPLFRKNRKDIGSILEA